MNPTNTTVTTFPLLRWEVIKVWAEPGDVQARTKVMSDYHTCQIDAENAAKEYADTDKDTTCFYYVRKAATRTCQRCYGEQILTIRARAKDGHSYDTPYATIEDSYAIWFSQPTTGSDTTCITLCASCGQIQGDFPIDLRPEKQV